MESKGCIHLEMVGEVSMKYLIKLCDKLNGKLMIF